MNVLIRQATTSDVPFVQKLYEELLNGEGSVNVLSKRVEEIATDQGNFLFVCQLEEQIVATAFIVICKDPMFGCTNFAILENFIVTYEYQQKGIGKEFLLFIEDFCRKQLCTKIMLQSSNYRVQAHRFYEKMGYTSDAAKGFKKYLNRDQRY